MIQHEYFLIQDEQSLRLLTFVRYTLEKCDIHELIEVNRFSKLTLRWQLESFILDKFSNFHGCRINFTVQGGYPEFTIIKIDNATKIITECEEYVGDITRDFSSVLNYTYHMNYLYNNNVIRPEKPCHLTLRYYSLSAQKMILPFDEKTWLWIGITFTPAFVTIFV